MAGEGGRARHSIAALLEHLEARPWDFDLYAALRLMEIAHNDKPTLGNARLPRDESVRIGSDPELKFPASALQRVENALGDRPAIYSHQMSLFGPHGPLPLHLTEYAHIRLQNAKDPTLVRFLDMFHHRAMLLFYRAWADANPAVQRHDGTPLFNTYVGAFMGGVFGAGHGELSNPEGLYLSGLISQQRKSVDGIQRIVQSIVGYDVRIDQFQGRWTEIAPENRSQLGVVGKCELGSSMAAGSRVWLVQHRFQVVVGPLGLRALTSLLPGSKLYDKVVRAVEVYTAKEFDWDIRLLVKKAEVPVVRLGRQGRLGMTAWLGEYTADHDSDEVVLKTG